MIEVTIRLFGAFRKYGDGETLRLQLPKGSSVKDVQQALAKRLAELQPPFKEENLLQDSAFANENSVLSLSTPLEQNCMIAVLPPVSGG